MVRIIRLGVLLIIFSHFTLSNSSFIPLNKRTRLTWHSRSCQTLGGELLSNEDLENADLNEIDGQLTACTEDGNTAIWTAQKQQKPALVDPKTGKALQLGLARFGRKPRVCPSLLKNDTVSKSCNLRAACSVCKIKENQPMTLKGKINIYVKTQISLSFRYSGLKRDPRLDTSYLISFDKPSNSILFSGTSNKSIIMPGNGTGWTLKYLDGIHQEILTVSDKDNFLPTGRKVWTDSSDKVCI